MQLAVNVQHQIACIITDQLWLVTPDARQPSAGARLVLEMSFIRNDVTKIKWTMQCGDFGKICMDDYGKKFLNGHISVKKEDIEL